jgi:hypothetical protein
VRLAANSRYQLPRKSFDDFVQLRCTAVSATFLGGCMLLNGHLPTVQLYATKQL